MFLKLSLAHHCRLYGIVHIYLWAKALREAKLTEQLLSVTWLPCTIWLVFFVCLFFWYILYLLTPCFFWTWSLKSSCVENKCIKRSAYFTIEQIYTQLVVRLVYKSTNIIDHSSGLLHFGASILILKSAWEPSCTQYFIQPRNVNKPLYLVVSHYLLFLSPPQQFLTFNPSRRISAFTALSHPYFQSVDSHSRSVYAAQPIPSNKSTMEERSAWKSSFPPPL